VPSTSRGSCSPTRIRSGRCGARAALGSREVIKHGLIRDAAFFTWIEANIDDSPGARREALERAVLRSVEIKADIVAKDERETVCAKCSTSRHTSGTP